MFNLLPGHGIGLSASREIAFGLGPMSYYTVPQVVIPSIIPAGGGVSWYDNELSRRNDDNEIVDILTILFQVIE